MTVGSNPCIVFKLLLCVSHPSVITILAAYIYIYIYIQVAPLQPDGCKLSVLYIYIYIYIYQGWEIGSDSNR